MPECVARPSRAAVDVGATSRRKRAACALAMAVGALAAPHLDVRQIVDQPTKFVGHRPQHSRAISAAALRQPGWLVDVGPSVSIAYRPETAAAAAALRPRLGAAVAALGDAFGASLPEPFTIRLYASDGAYGADHPLARKVGGSWVEEHRPRREASLVAPFTADGSVDVNALEVSVRYALAHQLLAHASNGRLPSGLQEGMARLMTPPSGETQTGVAALRSAMDTGTLIGWTALIGPGSAYVQPEVGVPESLSIAVFLVRDRGFDCIRDVAHASAGDVPFRTVFQAACGVSFAEAEAAWMAWLPRYVDGGWRDSPLFSPDLGPARQLLAEGEEAAVVPLLRAVVAANSGGPLAVDAGTMLARAEAGAAAQAALATAQAALAAGDYAAARRSAAEAGERAAPVGASGALERAAALDARGAEGLAAARDLDRATRLPAWQWVAARRAAHRAAILYARLGNDLAAQRAVAVRTSLDRRAAPFAWLAVLAGVGILAHAGRRRLRLARTSVGQGIAGQRPGTARTHRTAVPRRPSSQPPQPTAPP
ncbi:MAG: hypothetical protein IT332_06850 [Ardenticatenales bacterium]|nr:hypothetical protein [Ardenticatenales bacterium]